MVRRGQVGSSRRPRESQSGDLYTRSRLSTHAAPFPGLVGGSGKIKPAHAERSLACVVASDRYAPPIV